MPTEFGQKDYILYRRYYDKVLVLFEKELERIEKAGKKTLWYYGAQKTLKHLNEERGENLTPRDVDDIIFVLLGQMKQKQRKE